MIDRLGRIRVGDTYRLASRSALAADKIPGAANNLAWLLVVEGGSLAEARDLAALAVEEGLRRGEPEKNIESYRATLSQIEAAIKAGAGAKD